MAGPAPIAAALDPARRAARPSPTTPPPRTSPRTPPGQAGAAGRPGAEPSVPVWLSALSLGGGAGFALLAAAGAPAVEAIALLTGAAASGGLGLYGFAERLTQVRRRSLAQARDSFSALLEGAADPMALVDRSGRVRALNAAARRALAQARGEARGEAVERLGPLRAEELIPGAPEGRAAVFRLLRDALAGRAAEEILEAEQPDGTLRRVQAAAWPAGGDMAVWRWRPAPGGGASGENPRPSGADGARFETHGDAEIAWFRIGAKGRITASNAWFSRWIEGGAADARYPSFHTVFPDAAAALREGGGVDGLVETTRMVSGPEGPRMVSLMLAPSADGSSAAGLAIRSAQGAGLPLATPARAASAIETLDSARLFEDAPIGVMVLSAQGRILQLNAAADRLLTADRDGLPPGDAGGEPPGRRQEPLGARLVDWAHPEDREDVAERLATASVGSAGAGPAFEARMIVGGPLGAAREGAAGGALEETPAGAEWRAVQCLFSRVDAGEHRLLVGFLIDSGEQRGLEQSFIQGQRLQAVGQLAGGVAHDFNNLLTVILGCCESLLSRHMVDDPDYAELTDIDQSAQRAARLVKQLLAFSRRQHLAPETANVTELVSDLSSMLNRLIGDRIALQQDLAEDLWPVCIDIGQFQQVITNLVVNARDAMEGGTGKILIRTANETAATERPGLNFAMPPGEYVRVEVRDTGCGMPPAVIEKIFDPYFTTKDVDKGTGLGLATVYGIIKQTGGYIFVESEVGKGTTFRIFLPRLSEEDAGRRPGGDAPEAPLTGVAGAERFEALFDPAAPAAPARAEAAPGEGRPARSASPARKAPESAPADMAATAGSSGTHPSPAPKPEAETSRVATSSSATSLFDEVDALFGDGGGFGASDAGATEAPEATAKPRVAAPKPAASTGAATILLVEDETGVRSLFARDLRNRGYEVLEAENGEEALAILERPDQAIDLMLSDVMMPGMDGPSMLRRLGDRRPELKVVFMSGFTADAFAETLERALVAEREYGFLQKPFSLAQLRLRVIEELARR